MQTVQQRASEWHEKFNRFAGDLYPGRYTESFCRELAEQAEEIAALAIQKKSMLVAHNYQYPENIEVAGLVGDSLGLARDIQKLEPERIDYMAVYFMAATAKIIAGDKTRVFTCDTPKTLGCSLVFGTDHRWIKNWLKRNPGGVLCTYINSDAALKAMSTYVTTSRNTGAIIAKALVDHPDAQILVLPDKYLGSVMKAQALATLAEQGVDPATIAAYDKRIDVYTHPFGGFNACCEVHEPFGPDAQERAIEEHPNAIVFNHPECGCASHCLLKLSRGLLPKDRVYVLSTEQMYWNAKNSPYDEFLVATEPGMLYRLRRDMPDKTFLPLTPIGQGPEKGHCRFMKGNTLEKVLASLTEDKYETVFCDDCCDPQDPLIDGNRIHLPRSTAIAAKAAIDNMMAIG